MDTVILFMVMFILMLVLGMQFQITRINKRLDQFFKRMGSFVSDASKYASPKQ